MTRDVKGTTKVCGLIANPVKHTVSPAIHNTLADYLDDDLVYVPFEVQKGKVKEALEGALSMGILGLNVSVPYKSEVIPFLQEIDPVAERIGAVNTLVRTDNGSGFKGYNTDYYGLLKSFEDYDCPLRGESVILLGAGGVARPAAFLCAREGAKEVFILNRTVEKAEGLCREVNDFSQRDLCKAMSIKDYGKLPRDRKYICIQLTQVGMYPDNDSVVIDDPAFYELIHTGFDAVYRPFTTRFLSLCREHGARCISGLRMLLYQGIRAYELWNDTTVSAELAELVYNRLLKELIGGENILLIGFMGSGKSAVSKEIRKLIGYDRIDLDTYIEKKEKRKISEIFAENGESYFRDVESFSMRELAEGDRKNVILAAGGGLPIRKENREYMHDFGRIVFLKATPETVYERIKDDTSRPLLQTGDVLGKIRELQDKRRDIYMETADIEVDTDGKTIPQIAREILEAIL
ncbi:MAG: AAA family ATPase [Butyrivibrio sp.]|nr:AAA family ATPase [Butyrivibrio sp.]